MFEKYKLIITSIGRNCLAMDVVNFENIKKQIKKIPNHIKIKLLAWAKSVEKDGINEVSKHDY